MKISVQIIWIWIMVLIIGFSSAGCTSFNTNKCGESWLHVYYGGLGSGYRLVVLNDQSSLSFSGIQEWESFKEDGTGKIVFENENRIAINCEETITITTSSPPTVNTLVNQPIIKLIEPAEMIDIREELYDFVIR
jgi:hypothetical protein